MDKLDYWTMREGDEMKTAEEIVAEIKERKARYQIAMQGGAVMEGIFANYYIAMLTLLKWIEEKND